MRRTYLYSIMLMLTLSFTFSGCTFKKMGTSSKYYQPRDQGFLTYTSRALHKEYNNLKGTRYCYGGTTRRCFDCSGFIIYTYKKSFNKNLPRTTRQMAKKGVWISKRELEIGDLIFFKSGWHVSHAGIYMGNGKFMHSSSSRGVVISRLENSYWKKRYYSARRVLD